MNSTDLLSALPSSLESFLRRAGEVAAAKGHALYVVGGAVRDLLLDRAVLDVDLVAEAAASALASELAAALGCRITATSQFGTVKLEWQSVSVDVATARSESYHHAGALPTVAPGTIADDLARRDFCINAMALCLHPERRGALLDPHGGQQDLARKLVRVLHARSFQDDATRMLRALRYCARLDFGLDERTREWLLRDLSMLSTIGGERVSHEIKLILAEDRPEAVLALAQESGVLTAIHPAWRFTPQIGSWLVQARQVPIHRDDPEVALCLLAYPLSQEDAAGLARRLKLSGRRAQALEQTISLREQLAQSDVTKLAPSALYRALEHYGAPVVQAAAIAHPSQPVRERLRHYLKELRPQRPLLSGDDLMALGVPQGPEIGRYLRQLLDARLDGLVRDREDDVALVRRWAAEYENTAPEGSN